MQSPSIKGSGREIRAGKIRVRVFGTTGVNPVALFHAAVVLHRGGSVAGRQMGVPLEVPGRPDQLRF